MAMELILDSGYYFAIFFLPIVIYSLLSVTLTNGKGKGLYYVIKLVLAKSAVKQYQNECKRSVTRIEHDLLENVKEITSDKHSDNHFIYGVDKNGNSLSLRISLKARLVADTLICLRLSDGSNYVIPSGSTKLNSISGWKWKTKDLQIEILQPFHHLRIVYNGLLKNQDSGRIEHVYLTFTWNSASAPKFYPQDADTALLADAIAKDRWTDGNWVSLLGEEKGYEQFGELQGTVRGDSFDELDLRLPSCRTRFWGIDETLAVNNSIHLFVVGTYGNAFSLWVKNLKNGCSELKYGSYITGNGHLHSVSNVDLDLKNFYQRSELMKIFTVNVKADKQEHRCVFHLSNKLKYKTQNDGSRGYELLNIPADCDLNVQQAKSIVEFWYSSDSDLMHLPPPLLTEAQLTSLPTAYVISFHREEARSVRLTGGKGCSLAMLTSLKSNQFSVPDGFVVTVNAFNKQLESSLKLTKAVEILDDCFCGRKFCNLEEACLETVELIQNQKILPEIENEIKSAFENVQPDDIIDLHRWAVRSSGVGEDSEELSAAGQNETFLGCTSSDDVVKAISACWASLFTYQSVRYRHQHGLPMKAEMAVVVQRMVPAECAGVLFTCHPSTCNPSQIVITANHGLGESVVSGKSEPDTLILSRDYSNSLTIKSKNPGSKTKMIEMNESGTIERDGLSTFSISDEQALKLGQVGIQLEELFGSARDIEWAFYKNKLYLLQARPITTLQSWTDSELLHEFDSGTMTDKVVFTLANSGEVFPGATSILTLSTVTKCIDRGCQINARGKENPYSNTALPVIEQRVFIDVLTFLHKNPTKRDDISSRIIDLAVFGHPVFDDTIYSWSIERNGRLSGRQMLAELLRLGYHAWKVVNYLNKAIELNRTTEVGIDSKDSPHEAYIKIDNYLKKLLEIAIYHGRSSGTSVFYQIIAMQVLSEGATDLTMDHYTDIAQLLSSCEDVVSAEIPIILEQIAKSLRKNKKADEFLKVDSKLGREWLKNNCAEASELFEKFIEAHGHRGLTEFELMKSSWMMSPEEVIKFVQSHCKTDGEKQQRQFQPLDDVIANLISPKKNGTKKFLKFIMKRGRRAVGVREQTKSELVRGVNKLRIAYGQLAGKMRSAGVLPVENLIFHLSHYEIGQVIKEANPGIISKAIRRQRLYPQWNKFTYPEITYGVPRQANEETTVVGSGVVKCQGTPVRAGVVKARACVITSFDEIDQLQNGDILITHCTDIGWSPYFPLVSGIATELGGLVSHGAVIAREYGLPCIVGAKGILKVFKTGDIVVLSGKDGTIELVSDV